MTEKDAMKTRSALVLMTWLSPAFPVGGFAFSHGLEWAYESGCVTNRAALQDWLSDLLTEGSGRNDAILLVASFRAMQQREEDHGSSLEEIIALGASLQPTSERFLEANVQGVAFFKAVNASWPHDDLNGIGAEHAERLVYPVSLGIAAAAHGLQLESTVLAYLQAFTANLVSASVRLGIVGQTDGQRIMAALLPIMASLADASLRATLDDLGSSTLRADMMSFHHETQYSRLFRS